jgi:hypothetical protein
MYRIIGADGKEYGPITAEQLRQWLAEGRVNPQTKVLAEGSTDWKTLADSPELGLVQPVAPTPLTPLPAMTPDAARLVRGPAIFLLVLAILDLLASLVGVAFVALGQAIPTFPGMPQENVELQQKISFLFSVPAYALGIGIGVVRLIGSLKMMKLQSYNFAMATAILTLLPCGTCCCLINIGAGIWALVVLSKPEVKSAFQ